MIEFIGGDHKGYSNVTIREIEELIDELDSEGFFDSRLDYYDNFVAFCMKLKDVGQIITFRAGKKLIGFCCWAMLDEKRKHEVNKYRWLLPQNVTDGDVMYVAVCLLKKGASIFKIEKFLKSKYPRLKEVFWFNMKNGVRPYKLKFKGV